MKQDLDNLLAKVAVAFDDSDIKRWAETAEPRQYWYYSLAVTNMEPDGPLIAGFNWGASHGVQYEPQREIRKEIFAEADKGSLARLDRYFVALFGGDFMSKVSQTNYCFFRSKTEGQITNADLERCKGIFEELLAVMRPSVVLCFSAKLRDYLSKSGQVDFDRQRAVPYLSGKRQMTYYALRGRFRNGVEIVSLPHPNAKIPGAVHNKAWEFCFPQLATISA